MSVPGASDSEAGDKIALFSEPDINVTEIAPVSVIVAGHWTGRWRAKQYSTERDHHYEADPVPR